MEKHTHQFLKKQAVYWLKKKMTDLCAAEVKLFIKRKKRTADAVGINMKRKEVRIIEVKTSRSDFLRDDVLFDKNGYHTACHYAYLLTPEGMLQKDELPAGYGLLEADISGEITVVRSPVKNKAASLKLETLIKRTGRAATNAYLFQEETRLSKDRTDNMYEKDPIAFLQRLTCQHCRKRDTYLSADGADTAVCRFCSKEIAIKHARPYTISTYNEDFLETLQKCREDAHLPVSPG
ncbi:MmcB family DNA repair protein [Alkalicoccus urumqiensis]|uniref:Uncharacterized protein n=1 Tax=Alkalicoccus urumqiensis TaxID=1548213 RepID=A0A2P6MET1_ALKUR|nr:MmcB family DNA repair protein [Alkalicoccus urumqiensis]PRO64809.1 hypothetical protein C6I21_12935 [Alkalicoccus urumqiensis]